MRVRTTKKTVTFSKPFILGDSREALPAGAYEVETDEELVQGLSFHAYRRVLTLIHLPAKSGRPWLSRSLTIDPDDLDAALKRDGASATASVGHAPGEPTPGRTPKAREAEIDRRAVDRAENEGMIVHHG